MGESGYYAVLSALIPIAWALYSRYTNDKGIQLHFYNDAETCRLEIRNISNRTVYIDGIELYKSSGHSWNVFDSSESGSLRVDANQEKIMGIKQPTTDLIKELGIRTEEQLRLRVELDTSMGILQSGWIDAEIDNDDEERLAIRDNASNNILRMKAGSYAQVLGTIPIAFAISIIAISPMLTVEQAEELAFAVFLSMLTLEYFTFARGFKNVTWALLTSLCLSLLTVAPIVIASGSLRYLLLLMWFMPLLFMESALCSGIISQAETRKKKRRRRSRWAEEAAAQVVIAGSRTSSGNRKGSSCWRCRSSSWRTR